LAKFVAQKHRQLSRANPIPRPKTSKTHIVTQCTSPELLASQAAVRYRQGHSFDHFILTYAASGIGRACGVEFAKNGSRGILIADINLDAAIQAAEEARAVATHPQFRAEAVQVDVAQHESVKRACDRMIELFGRMDYCIHAAGVPGSKMVGIADSDYDDFKRVNSINVDGTYLVLRAVSAVMKAQEPRPVESSEDWRGTTRGAIVVMASLASLTTVSGMAAYNTSKHAVMGLTKTAGTQD
jgi:NAD(P)-dependent dehydrogenase (short-subunit alcohol dehydrogenase family)